jgi:hypothetical protein
MKTVILPCACRNEYQDKKYGEQKRVHNLMTSKIFPTYRCTVCGNERQYGSADVKK